MGWLSRVGFEDLVVAHKINALVETGTGRCNTLESAVKIKALKDIRSIEIDYETWRGARAAYAQEPRVQLYHGDSVEVLRAILPGLATSRVLWFLDAHYPGSGRQISPLPMTAKTVPLERELRLLLAWRDLSQDVIVIDDLCLFEPNDYEVDYPDMRKDLGAGDLHWLDKALEATHSIARVLIDGGYLLAVPK